MTVGLAEPATGSTPIPRDRVRPASWLAVGAAMFAVAWGGNEFTPLLVLYREVSDFSAFTVDLLLGAYVVGIIPALLIGGPLSDRYGRRPVMLPAAPLALLGSLLIALWPGSVPVLAIGRVLCGAALGLVMAVGTTWVKELSGRSPGAVGAQRAAMSLTGGFLLGAAVAATLAQWAPLPTVLPYGIHIVLAVVAGIWLLRAPETRQAVPRADRAPLRTDLRIPRLSEPRFRRVGLPVAPWVFGAAGIAYAVLPSLLVAESGGMPVAFSGLMSVIGLGSGFLAQLVARRIDRPGTARASTVALVVLAAGCALAVAAAATLLVPLGIVAAIVLGVGYGFALVAGLAEVQRLAGPDDLAGLNAVFYSLAYLGFWVPGVLSALSAWWSYPWMLGVVALLSIGCLAVVMTADRMRR